MGNLTPTKFLAHLHSIAPSNTNNILLKTCFLEQLPERVRSVVSILTTDNLDEIAEAADRICEVGVSQQPEICAIKTSASTAVLEAIMTRLDSLERQLRDRGRSHSRGRQLKFRSRSRGRRDDSSESRDHGGKCWYHHTFGQKANKCKPPCNVGKKDFPASEN